MVSFILFLSFISFALSTYLKSKQNYNLEVKLKEVTAEYDEINKKSEEQNKLLKEIKKKYEKASQLNKKLKTTANTESGIETKTISKRKELEKKKKRLQKAIGGIKKFFGDFSPQLAAALAAHAITTTDWNAMIASVEKLISSL